MWLQNSFLSYYTLALIIMLAFILHNNLFTCVRIARNQVSVPLDSLQEILLRTYYYFSNKSTIVPITTSETALTIRLYFSFV